MMPRKKGLRRTHTHTGSQQRCPWALGPSPSGHRCSPEWTRGAGTGSGEGRGPSTCAPGAPAQEEQESRRGWHGVPAGGAALCPLGRARGWGGAGFWKPPRNPPAPAGSASRTVRVGAVEGVGLGEGFSRSVVPRHTGSRLCSHLDVLLVNSMLSITLHPPGRAGWAALGQTLNLSFGELGGDVKDS